MKLKFALIWIACLSMTAGCASNKNSTASKALVNHPRAYPQSNLIGTALAAMKQIEAEDGTRFSDSIEKYMEMFVKIDTQVIHDNYFSDYPTFNVSFEKGVIQDTPDSLKGIGRYMMSKEVTVYAVTGKNHTCVYSLYYLVGANRYKSVRTSDINYATVDGGYPTSCLSYDYSR